jgi:CDP-diacylglycerol--glycerol-3-phosphate 3-phosphatidyltransferase
MDRSLFALFNLVLIFGAALLGMRIYRSSNPDLSQVRGSRLLGSAIRGWYFSNLEPFEMLFARLGVSPTALTYLQLVGSGLCAAAYASGLIYCAGFLLLASGTLDILDGKLARRTGWASSRGAFLDSVIDRYAEFVVWMGLLVHFGSGWHVWGVLLALLGGTMVSYARARAEGLGASCEVGFLQRPERFVLLGFGSIFSSVAAHVFGSGDGLLVVVVWLLALLSNATALQRIVHVARALRDGGNGGG